MVTVLPSTIAWNFLCSPMAVGRHKRDGQRLVGEWCGRCDGGWCRQGVLRSATEYLVRGKEQGKERGKEQGQERGKEPKEGEAPCLVAEAWKALAMLIWGEVAMSSSARNKGEE